MQLNRIYLEFHVLSGIIVLKYVQLFRSSLRSSENLETEDEGHELLSAVAVVQKKKRK